MNVHIASERKQRKLVKEIVGDNLVSENGAFTFTTDHGDEIREVPFVYVPNFIAKVADVVSQHESYRAPAGLTNHGGSIPENELWVKLGGDKGQGSFKFNLQLVNVVNPNSVKRTVLLSVFNAGDSTTNLHTALSLGIYNRLWSLLIGACTELDLNLALLISGDSTPSGSSTYDHFSTLLRKKSISSLTMPDAESNSFLGQLRKSAADAHKTLQKMVWLDRENSHIYSHLIVHRPIQI